MRICRCGSSPLARGLREDQRAHHRRHRIIPARAGFTQQGGATGTVGADHPRSRGVYHVFLSSCSQSAGSSPLARGLLWPDPTLKRDARIIPARAGFTMPTKDPHTRNADHPRSRGVYVGDGLGMDPQEGSSPLARGLRGPDVGAGGVAGIIPARAGFTRPWPAPPRRTPDHPRSRGVYHREGHRRGRREGSSPLARGLRTQEFLRVLNRRIIPARAGFTSPSRGTPLCTPDHPRSRGVYRTSVSVFAGGSRIIPARAGFTRAGLLRSPSTRDHPRSRGVYH